MVTAELSACESLKKLTLTQDNSLTTVTYPVNGRMDSFVCTDNSELVSVDMRALKSINNTNISTCAKLTGIRADGVKIGKMLITYNNALTSLDLSQSIVGGKDDYIIIRQNTSLKSLKVPTQIAETGETYYIDVSDNALENLTLTGAPLSAVTCENNRLQGLDFTNVGYSQEKGIYVNCNNNRFFLRCLQMKTGLPRSNLTER